MRYGLLWVFVLVSCAPSNGSAPPADRSTAPVTASKPTAQRRPPAAKLDLRLPLPRQRRQDVLTQSAPCRAGLDATRDNCIFTAQLGDLPCSQSGGCTHWEYGFTRAGLVEHAKAQRTAVDVDADEFAKFLNSHQRIRAALIERFSQPKVELRERTWSELMAAPADATLVMMHACWQHGKATATLTLTAINSHHTYVATKVSVDHPRPCSRR